MIVSLCVLVGSAAADVEVCSPNATHKCASPRGVATDFESGLLYVADNDVADNGNDRIDVFKNGGTEPGTPASFAGGSEPIWIAVDNVPSSPSHHDIYATTTSDFKVKKFEPNGTLADEFGEHSIHPGAPQNCELERADDPIAVGPEGDVYLADSYPTGAPGNFTSRIVKFDAAGNCLGAVSLEKIEAQNQTISSLAVDSTGIIYVTVKNFTVGELIRQYSSTGKLEGKEFEELETKGLAVDAEDHLFAEQRYRRKTKEELDHFFTEYDSAASGGAILRRFAYAPSGISSPPGLAALNTPNVGDLFASDPEGPEAGVRYLKLPPPGPVAFPKACEVEEGKLGSIRATLQAEVDPEGKATEFRFEYEPLGGAGAPFEHAQASNPVKLEEKGVPVEDFELHEAAQKVEPLEAETKYRCRVAMKNADGETKGPEGSFKTNEPFSFGPAWASEVKETSATVNAEGNPNGSEWSGQVEYVTDAQYQASKFAEAKRTPTSPLDYGSEEAMTLRSTTLTGLAPGTLYHYRLRATQPAFPEGLVCPEENVKHGECPELEHTLRTYLPGEARPDHRGYELVSPAQKNSAEVVGSTQNGRGFIDVSAVLIQAGAASGEAVTYTSWTSFANGQGAPSTSQYLSHRTPVGWVTDNISPFGFQSNFFVPPYLGFTPELGFGAVKAGETPLSPGCPAEVEDFYFYEAASGHYRCLTTEPPINPPGKFGYFFIYGGASEDGSHVFFKGRVRYANAKAGSGTNLYESHEGQVRVVNVLPEQTEPTPPTPATTFGMKSPEIAQTGQTVLHNAISADGSHAIWTYVPAPAAEYESSQLLDRIDGSETVQIDAKQGSAPQSGGGNFWAASTDGQVVYFTSPKRLVTGAKAEPGAEDLYRYDFSEPLGSRLTDLTKGSTAGEVQGVIGAAEDGTDVYFVAGAALTPESEENAAGQHAEAGADNLYVNDMGEGKTHFIAQLSGEDNLDWTAQPKSITARVSADGQSLAFLSSEASLSAAVGFDNTLPNTKSASRFAAAQKCRVSEIDALFGTSACPEAFIYAKGPNTLTCASCNPSGSRPLGPTLLPSWSNIAEGPRYLSADGNRLFFETYDRLLPEDENELRDVYEFEHAGAGTCSANSPNFDPLSGGCHFLVSNGKSTDESFLIDASSTGRDVFFSTRSALNGWDTNENYDVYDYREGGGFPEPVPPVTCEGEAGCKPPATTPPPPPRPATPSFNGPGNLKPKQAKKHHRKKGRGKGKKKHKGAKKKGAKG